jgi:NADP-dependent 3-hydroxy acid dehydrogenase YdfG
MRLLQGRVALITGGTGGIGRAIALDLAGRGMDVVLAGRDASRLESTRLALAEETGCPIRALTIDLTRPSTIDGVAATLGTIDVLVHAAGMYLAKSLADVTPDEVARQFATNVTGPARLTAELLPSVRARRGQIVFVSSSAVKRAPRGVELYASSKFALTAFAANLRRDVNRDGVRVLVVYPGRTATMLQERIHDAEGQPYDPSALVQPDDLARMIGSALELPMTAEVTDLHVRPAQEPRR